MRFINLMRNCSRMFRSTNFVRALYLESLSKHGMKALIIGPVVSLLMSCASAPPAPPSYELTFQHLPRLQIAAGSIVLKSAYQPDAVENQIDTQKPQNPTLVVKQWVEDRLERQSGSTAKLVLTVIDGRVVSKQETQAATFGFLTSKKMVYSASLVVDVAYYPAGMEIGQAIGKDLRVKIVSDKAVSGAYNLNMLDEAYFMLISDLANEFDKQMHLVLKKLKII